MASVTIKNIPDALLGSLRAHAAAAKRSMNRDVIHLLEVALMAQSSSRFQSNDQGAQQVAAWEKLAGRWVSDQKTAEEIGDIYASRTAGREFDF